MKSLGTDLQDKAGDNSSGSLGTGKKVGEDSSDNEETDVAAAVSDWSDEMEAEHESKEVEEEEEECAKKRKSSGSKEEVKASKIIKEEVLLQAKKKAIETLNRFVLSNPLILVTHEEGQDLRALSDAEFNRLLQRVYKPEWGNSPEKLKQKLLCVNESRRRILIGHRCPQDGRMCPAAAWCQTPGGGGGGGGPESS
jgi:hypothetical protein